MAAGCRCTTRGQQPAAAARRAGLCTSRPACRQRSRGYQVSMVCRPLPGSRANSYLCCELRAIITPLPSSFLPPTPSHPV